MTTALEQKRMARIPPVPCNRWHDAEDIRWAARQWAARIGVTVRSIHLRPMARKWACMSVAGRLTLSSDLLNIARDLGEFVLVHELVHLLCPEARHGRVFKAFMGAYLPDWAERLRQLDALTPTARSPSPHTR